MVDPNKPESSRSKWLWPLVIAGIGVLAVIVFFNPSGDRDGDVDTPIDMEETTGENDGTDPTAPAPEPFAPGGD
ncbi:hypothetical protein [Erythrobacter sp. HL-111]|uniref:hypothetical protein n=1 Tax=Erythrobacter sp. HL-111 TaxID=1798193 RepID=UPI0006D9EDAB|nr:hypothetical protein [Erythrobacter sp. HL-111]KPP90123.1 MAG: hypothetical protein HLUCCO15_09760 [Erythrobacteraceae bacterium HL-111]SDR80906.1 hypothetical protein SAMN04515621_0417 [Erythrobacter sp. HL-111]